MNAEIALAAVVAGIGTYLVRFLPLKAAETFTGLGSDGKVGRFLAGIGPAAVMALLVISLVGLLEPAGSSGMHSFLKVVAGLAAVFLVHRATRNVAFATLAGAVAFGGAAALLT